jgi:hypothetical protein
MAIEISEISNNYIGFCLENYRNEHCLCIKDFENDLKTLKYIKASFRKYLASKDVKTSVLLNHFVYFRNCFGDASPYIMFYDFCDYYYPFLKTVFYHMKALPEIIYTSDNPIQTKNIDVDAELYRKLLQTKHIF